MATRYLPAPVPLDVLAVPEYLSRELRRVAQFISNISVEAGATDLSYSAATRVLASSTGADVTLPLFTSALAGLAPGSGGGTSNFLRADGSWAAPSGVTNHGALTGLADDDHTQYILVAGTRAFTGDQQTQALTPVADATHSLGSTAARYATVHANNVGIVKATAGSPTITLGTNGSIVGIASLTAGSATLNATGATNFPALVYGGARCTAAGGSASLICTGSSGFVFGHINSSGIAGTISATSPGACASGFISGSNGTGAVTASAQGAFARGYVANSIASTTARVVASQLGATAVGAADNYTSALLATGKGSSAFGYVFGGGTLQATEDGAVAFGYVNGPSTGTTTWEISANGKGAFAQGRVAASGSIAVIEAQADGCLAQGVASGATICAGRNAAGTITNIDGALARGAAYGGDIEAFGFGAFASGHADSSSIIASGAGAVALGITSDHFPIISSGGGALAVGLTDGAGIVASADNSAQFFPGTNAETNTLKIGTAGLRLKGTTGAPGTPGNGDIYMGGTGNAFVMVRSNGKAVQTNTGAAGWTVGSYATRRSFAGLTPTTNEVLELLETLVEELQAANIIN